MKYKYRLGAWILSAALLLGGCGSGTTGTSSLRDEVQSSSQSDEVQSSSQSEKAQSSSQSEEVQSSSQSEETKPSSQGEEIKDASPDVEVRVVLEDAPELAGLAYDGSMELAYANCFSVHYYEGDLALIDVYGDSRYLVVPEGAEAPAELDEDIVVIAQPLDQIYLAATSAMALFSAMDAVDFITMTGTNANGWYIDSAVKAMEEGKIKFAGKYSAPDYEMLVDEGCDLAIESTMIYHTPKVKEMIEMLGIPVLVDRSSYESHPLGRTEWIKLYSVLVDKEAEAKAFFDEQARVIEELKGFESTDQTVVYFYISTDGTAVVRKPDDYIPRMIELAGGVYAFSQLPEGGNASVPLTMEEFYATAVNADYLIYNASIDNPIESMEDLMSKSPLFADFKAVKEGHVWSTGKSLYQATDTVGNLIRDIHLMLTGGAESEMQFIHRIQ